LVIKTVIRKIVFATVYLLFFLSISAQERSIKGVVSDSIENPIPWANVVAIPQDKSDGPKFAVTDDKGRYQLFLSKKISYEISVTFLGYQKFIFLLSPDNPIQNINIKLQTANNMLGEVLIIEQPVTKHHDTLSYNVEAFKTGDERKLKDIIEKLPGIEMDKRGQITVQGKKVTKLTVDGKDFFGGGTKLAVDNIPADAVMGIDFVDKYQSVGFMKDFDESEELAMNIKLKKEKKKFAFGSIDAGSDVNDKYVGHANLFYYSPKTNVNFIGDINNAGQQFFTYSNVRDFEGGYGSMFREGIFGKELFNGDLYNLTQNQHFTNRDNKFGACNLSSQLSNKLKFSCYVIGSITSIGDQSISDKNYLLNELSYDEKCSSKGITNNNFGISKFVFDYSPSDMESFYFQTKVKYSEDRSIKNIVSDIENIRSNFDQNSKNKVSSIVQNIEWNKKISRDRAISAGISYNYNDKSPEQNWISDTLLLQGLIPLVTDSIYRVNQQKRITSHKLNIVVKHYWNVTNLSQFNIWLGNYYVNDAYQSNEKQLLSDGSAFDFNQAGFGNNMKLIFNDFFISLNYKVKRGIATMNLGFNNHYFLWEIEQGLKTSRQKISVLPDFSLKFNFTSTMDLNLAYQIKSQFPQTPNLSKNYTLQDYYTVQKGNPGLENELYHNATLYYSNFSMFRKLMMYVHFTFMKKISGLTYQTKIENQKYYTYPVLISNPETSWSFGSNISKGIGKFRLVLGANMNLSDYLQDINDNLLKYRSISQIIFTEIRTNYKKWPNISLGYQFGQSTIKSNDTKNAMFTGTPSFSVKYDFLKGMILNVSYRIEYNRNQNTGQTNRFDMANASIYYQHKKSPWGFEVSTTNLFDKKTMVRCSVSDYLSVIDKTFIFPRIFLFTISYNL
jgi:hypothetical protein